MTNQPDLKTLLNSYITKAFQHEREFIDTFWQGNNADELLECYMASERTRIAVLVETGATVTTTISTDAFIDWCDSKP